jgi:hypothetical protein
MPHHRTGLKFMDLRRTRKTGRNACGLLVIACVALAATNRTACAVDSVIAGWDVNGLPGGNNNFGPSPLTASTAAANVTVGGLTRGSGVATSGTGAARGWGGTDWVASSAAAAVTAQDYVTFTVQPSAGFALSLSSFNPFEYRRSGTGPDNGELQYSIGGSFVDIAPLSYSNTASTGAAIAAINLSGISALQNISSTAPVTFRIANYRATAGGSSAGTWYIFDVGTDSGVNDFALNGSVAAVASSGNNSVITAPASATFDRVMLHQTPTTNFNLTKTGSDATTYTATPSAGIAVTADGMIAGGAQSEPVSVQLQNISAGSASTGVKSYNVVVDNTAADSAASGQGSADADDTVAVTATVVDNRTITASTANLGNVIKGALTAPATSALTTTGDDNDFTRVTVNGTAATSGSVTVAAGASQLFDGAADTVNRSVQGTFATAGAKSGNVVLSVTGESLTGESANAVLVPYTANVYDPSTAKFVSNNGTTVNVDFGTVQQGSGVHSLNEAIYNALQTAGFTAGLDFDSIAGTGNTGTLFTDLVAGAFANLTAGVGNAYGFSMKFDANSPVGVYSATYDLGFSDSDLYTGASAPGSQHLTLNLTGTVVPESGWTILLVLVIGLPVMAVCRRSLA